MSKKMQTIDLGERSKIAKLQNEIRQDSDKKMEWLYTGDKIDRNAYLLGKPIDKILLEQELDKPKESDYTTNTIDLANKIREDPLFEIKKREIEAKKKILENPLKLKQLKKMVSMSSDSGSDSNSDSDKKRKEKKKHKKSKKSHKKYKYSESDDSHEEKRSKKRRSRSRSNDKYRRSRSRDKNRSRSRGRDRPEPRPGYGLNRSRNDRSRDRSRERDNSKISKSKLEVEEYKNRMKKLENIRKTSEIDLKSDKGRPVSSKLSDEEKQRRLREMEENAKWRDDVRNKNIKTYRYDENKEEDLQQKDKSKRMQAEASSLFNSMMNDAYSSTEDRIKRNIYKLQKNSSSLD